MTPRPGGSKKGKKRIRRKKLERRTEVEEDKIIQSLSEVE